MTPVPSLQSLCTTEVRQQILVNWIGYKNHHKALGLETDTQRPYYLVLGRSAYPIALEATFVHRHPGVNYCLEDSIFNPNTSTADFFRIQNSAVDVVIQPLTIELTRFCDQCSHLRYHELLTSDSFPSTAAVWTFDLLTTVQTSNDSLNTVFCFVTIWIYNLI